MTNDKTKYYSTKHTSKLNTNLPVTLSKKINNELRGKKHSM